MASITNPFQSSIQTSRFSSLYLSPNRATTCHLVLKTGSMTSKATRLAFSPFPESRGPPTPVEFPGKALRFSGWNQLLRRRGSVEFPVVAATAADADGSKSSLSFFLFLFSSVNYFTLRLGAETMELKKKVFLVYFFLHVISQ
jgi:hypothetical protein